MIKKRSNWKWR